MKSFCVFLAIVSACSAAKEPAMCGYHGTPMKGPVEEPADLSPAKFWNDYVRRAEPVVIRGAVKDDPAIKLWKDEYVLKNFGHLKVRMEPKDEGGRHGDERTPSLDTMSNFYSKWMQGSYVVTQLPGAMNNESSVITCMSCGPIRDQFIEANLWISTGDTNSKIHKDSNNQMNCLYQGIKDWTLFAPEHSKSMYLVNERPGLDQMYDTAGFSRIATRNIDLKQFPKFAKVPFMKVRVNPGDCIYVPGTYMHHVYSSGHRNLQVSMLFAGPDIPTAMQRVHGKKEGGPLFEAADDQGNTCGTKVKQEAVKIGLVDVAWPFDGKGAITMGFSNPTSYGKEWKQAVQRKAQQKGGFLQKPDFQKIFVNFINQMDPCNDATAKFGNEQETRRHVFEALDVLYPEHAGNWDHWKADCSGGACKIPKLCTMLTQKTKDQADALFDKVGKDGKLDPIEFSKLPRRTLQDAMTAPFVRDQIAAVFEEVTGDYDGADGQDATFERGDGGDDDDGDGEDNEKGKDDL